MNIIKNLIERNFNKLTNKQNQYIVIHYTTSMNSGKNSALNSRGWFNNIAAGASAHYIVDDFEIIQAVEDSDKSWHCGGSKYKNTKGGKFYGICTNSNSIGIEMSSNNNSGKAYKDCSSDDKDWFFTEETLEKTADLVVYLMEKYDIPLSNVIRHYDVTGKICPAPFVHEEAQWTNFKKRIENKLCENKKENDIMKDEEFKKLFDELRKELQDNDSSAWSKDAREWAVNYGLVKGDGSGNYMWEDFITREQLVTILYRMFNR